MGFGSGFRGLIASASLKLGQREGWRNGGSGFRGLIASASLKRRNLYDNAVEALKADSEA